MTHLASVDIIFGKTLLRRIALWADILIAKLLKWLLASVDVPTVNADVGGKLLLLGSKPAAKPSRCRLLVQSPHIDSALSPHLQAK